MTVDASAPLSSDPIRLSGRPFAIFSLLSLLLLFVASGCADRTRSADANSAGADVFADRCAVCHALPILESLFEQNRGRPPGFVYDALTRGNMRRVGAELDDASRRAVAEFFTGVAFDSPAAERDFTVSPRCSR